MPLLLAAGEVRGRVTYSCEKRKQISLLKACFKNTLLGRVLWHLGNWICMLTHEKWVCGDRGGLNACVLCWWTSAQAGSKWVDLQIYLPELNFLIWILEQDLYSCSCNMNNLRAVAFNLIWLVNQTFSSVSKLFFIGFADLVRSLKYTFAVLHVLITFFLLS